MRTSWYSTLFKKKKPIIVALTLLTLLGFSHSYAGKCACIDNQTAEELTPVSMKPYLGAQFKDYFTLRGLSVKCNPSELEIKLAWEKTGLKKERMTNAVHFINTAGVILGQADYKQPEGAPKLKFGDIWLDSINIHRDQLAAGVTGLAIAIYDQKEGILSINHKNTDWGGKRLIVNLDQCLHPK